MRVRVWGVMMMFRVPSVLIVAEEMLMLVASVASDDDDGAPIMPLARCADADAPVICGWTARKNPP